jgi:hypothetical protein
MDGSRFDSLTRSLAVSGSRRRLLGGFAAGALGLVGLREVDAACRNVGLICRENANCCSGYCGPKDKTGRRRCAVRTYELTCTPFGDATPGPNGVVLRSVCSANPPYGGCNFALPDNSIQFSDILTLGATYTPEGDDNCFGGSPRFEVYIDTNCDDTNNRTINVYLGTYPNFVCPGGGSVANAIGSSDLRFDITHLQNNGECVVNAPNAFYATYAQAAACVGDQPVIGMSAVVDSCWGFGDQEQTITINPTVVVTDSTPNGGTSPGCIP